MNREGETPYQVSLQLGRGNREIADLLWKDGAGDPLCAQSLDAARATVYFAFRLHTSARYLFL